MGCLQLQYLFKCHNAIVWKILLLLAYTLTQRHVKPLNIFKLFRAFFFLLVCCQKAQGDTMSPLQGGATTAFAGTSVVCEQNSLPTSVWEAVCVGKARLYLTGKWLRSAIFS